MEPLAPLPDLKSRLVTCALAWVSAQSDDAPLSRLGKRVMDDARFFSRLDDSRSGPTTSTLEKFARFLVAPENWPDGTVPAEVCAFAHAVGVPGPACAPPNDFFDIGDPPLAAEPQPAEPEHALLREPSGRTPPAPCDSPAGGAGQPAVDPPRAQIGAGSAAGLGPANTTPAPDGGTRLRRPQAEAELIKGPTRLRRRSAEAEPIEGPAE